ncbi:MAG: hypothetical protein LBH12_02900, partial [Dysgonamonadaceae bacterium]|nr:hypothetical protein [Dysgonamonadaceae bacterium]
MIRTDFLIRQITELIQALSALVLKRKTSAEETINPSLIDSGINLLRIKKERFFSLSAAGLIDVFSKQSFGSDKIELAAYLLLLDERNSKISHKHTAR